jgi:hypothetical protein
VTTSEKTVELIEGVQENEKFAVRKCVFKDTQPRWQLVDESVGRGWDGLHTKNEKWYVTPQHQSLAVQTSGQAVISLIKQMSR